MLSRAIGLFGALLAVGPTSGAELHCGTGDAPRVWVTALLPRVVERYCFTCCRCACWMWYLVGFSKWVCTWSFKQLLRACVLMKTLCTGLRIDDHGQRMLLPSAPPQAPVLEVDVQHLGAVWQRWLEWSQRPGAERQRPAAGPHVSPAPGLVLASAAAAATHVTTWLRTQIQI